jgi:hypothetical protein
MTVTILTGDFVVLISSLWQIFLQILKELSLLNSHPSHEFVMSVITNIFELKSFVLSMISFGNSTNYTELK